MPAPANDLCAAATVIASLPYAVSGVDNTSATESVDDPTLVWAGDGTAAGAAAIFKTTFYRYTPAATQTVRLTCNQNGIDFGVYTGACGALVEVASFRRQLTIELQGGTAYTIMVGSEANTGITFDFSLATSTAPPNQIQTTAKPVGLLASTFTASVDFTGVTDEALAFPAVVGKSRHVWYYYDAVAGDEVIGLFGFGNLSTFAPQTDAYQAPFNIFAPAAIGGPNSNYTLSAVNVPAFLPVTPGTRYYFRFGLAQAAAITDTLGVQVRKFAKQNVPVGSYAIPDDGSYFPLAIFDATTGEVLRFIAAGSYAASEGGDIQPSGKVFMGDPGYGYNGALTGEYVRLYTSKFELLLSAAATISGQSPVTSGPDGVSWFIGNVDGNSLKVTKYNDSLAVLDTWTVAVDPLLGSSSLMGIAVSPDGATLYYSCFNIIAGPIVPVAIHRWDLVNDVALSDLVAAGSYVPVREMICLADGSLVVAYWDHAGGGVGSRVIRYSSAGAVLNTWTRGDTVSLEMRLARDVANPTVFGIWTKIAGNLSRFERINTTTGLVLSTLTIPHHSPAGVLDITPTATPAYFYAPSFCCPWFILPVTLLTTEGPNPDGGGDDGGGDDGGSSGGDRDNDGIPDYQGGEDTCAIVRPRIGCWSASQDVASAACAAPFTGPPRAGCWTPFSLDDLQTGLSE